MPRIRFSLKTIFSLMVVVACSLLSYRVGGWPMKVWRPADFELRVAEGYGYDPFDFTDFDEPRAVEFFKEHNLPEPTPFHQKWGTISSFPGGGEYLVELRFSYRALAINAFVILLAWFATFAIFSSRVVQKSSNAP